MFVILAACNPDGSGRDGDHVVVERGILTIETWSDQSDRNGRITVEVEVDAATTSFAVTASAPSDWPVVEAIVDPDGNEVVTAEQWLDSDRTLTTAFDRMKKTTSIGWPARPVDGELTPGTWTVEFTTVVDPRVPVGDVPLDMAIHTKRDGDLTEGTLEVAVVYADGVDDDAADVTAIDTATAQMVAVFARYGITVETSTHPSSLDPAMSFTGFADPAVAAVARQVTDPGDLVLVIGEDYADGPTTRGSSPSVPGSLLPTAYLFSSAGLAPHAGTDGAFDANEIAMLAQTMTHELGHFMGLSHVVEIGYTQWDAVDDTPICRAWDECEDLMDHNLVYPHVNCDGAGDCIVNDQLTPDQVGMLHRFVGVL